MLKPVLEKSKCLFKHPFLSLYQDSVSFEDGVIDLGAQELLVVRKKPVVSIIPILGDGSVVMVNQYRHPVGVCLWEFPAGHIEGGEFADFAAVRELKEETGYTPTRLINKGTFYVSPGFTDEAVTFFLAIGLKEGEPMPDDGEDITVAKFKISDIFDLGIQGLKTQMGLMFAQAYLNKKG